MTDDEADVRAAREALARVNEVGGPAARAARRAVRLHLYATGVAMSLLVVLEVAGRWLGPSAVWPRAALAALVWGGLFGTVSLLMTRQPVRAVPAQGLLWTLTLASVVLLGLTIGIGQEHPVAYPVGAAALFGVWAIGAARVGK
jgi:hypothetical protein